MLQFSVVIFVYFDLFYLTGERCPMSGWSASIRAVLARTQKKTLKT